MVSDMRRLAATGTVLVLSLVPAAGAAQMANLADLCAESGAAPVTENTLILRTTKAIPSSCTIDLVDASLRIVGAEIATTALAIFRTGAGTVEITGFDDRGGGGLFHHRRGRPGADHRQQPEREQ